MRHEESGFTRLFFFHDFSRNFRIYYESGIIKVIHNQFLRVLNAIYKIYKR